MRETEVGTTVEMGDRVGASMRKRAGGDAVFVLVGEDMGDRDVGTE